MKHLFTFFLIGFFASAINAQTYSASASTSAFNYLTNDSVITASPWDDIDIQVRLPIPFSYYGRQVDSITISDGYCYFLQDSLEFIDVFSEDLQNRSTTLMVSPISVKTEGSAPIRIFKIQWKNVGFFEDASNVDSISFQLWLYEGTNVIECRYGSNKVSPGSYTNGKGAFVGVNNYDMTDIVEISGTPASPTITHNPANVNSLNGTPADGQVYKFTPAALVGIVDELNPNHLAYPNPFSNFIEVKSEDIVSLILTDIQGKQMDVDYSGNLINTENLGKGVYFLIIETHQGTTTIKVIK